MNRGTRTVLVETGTTLSQSTLHFSVGIRDKEKFSALLKESPDGVPLVLSTSIDKRANAFLVWSPGKPCAVGPHGSDGSRMGGAYLQLVSGAEKNRGGQAGDGFVVFVRAKDWAELRNAVLAGKNFQLSLENENLKQLSIEFVQPVDVNIRSRTAVGVWQTYHPDNHNKQALPKSPAERHQPLSDAANVYLVNLMTPDENIRERIEVQTLGAYSAEITEVVQNFFKNKPRSTKSFDLVIRSTIKSKNVAHYKISWKPDENLMAELYQTLQTTKVPDADGEVDIELIAEVWKTPTTTPK